MNLSNKIPIAKIVGFHSPKTSGCTTIALNTAILHQSLYPTKKIALLQLTAFPDLHFQSGLEPIYDIGQLYDFLKTDEWTPSLLNKIKQNQGCDLFFSPSFSTWKNLSLDNFQHIFSLIAQNYDLLYLDLHASIPSSIQKLMHEKLNLLFLISNIDPPSLNATTIFWESFPNLQHKIKLILNQCPKGRENEIKNRFLGTDIPLDTTFISDSKYLWHQIYEGFPIAFQKESKLKKQIISFIEILESV